MRVIKDCLVHILPVLTDIINSSLMTSAYPDAWKHAEVIPLLKEGDHEVATNNRPLSLLKYYHTGFPDRAGTVPTPKYGKSAKKSWPSREGRGMIGVSRGMFVRIGNGATTV